MGVLFAKPELFAVYVKVAHEYKLPFLALRGPQAPPALLSMLTEKMSSSIHSSWPILP